MHRGEYEKYSKLPKYGRLNDKNEKYNQIAKEKQTKWAEYRRSATKKVKG
jgi:hypothetical protein